MRNSTSQHDINFVCTSTPSVLCAGIASLLTQHAVHVLLQLQAVITGLTAVTCLGAQQSENGAAFSHAAVQTVAFLQGHGKLARMPSCNNDLLTDFVYLMLRTLTHHPSSYIKPGGYSEQSFSMVVDYCVKRQASKKASKVVTDSAAQVIRSHNSWCLELSPLLTRYHMAWWCLQPLT